MRRASIEGEVSARPVCILEAILPRSVRTCEGIARCLGLSPSRLSAELSRRRAEVRAAFIGLLAEPGPDA